MFSRPVLSTGLFLLIILGSFQAHAQHRFKGKILSRGDRTPIPYASVIARAARNAGGMTDTSGRYNFWYSRSIRQTDSVIISAIGYKPLKMAMSQLAENPEILMDETPNMLENVVVVSTLRGNQNQFGYFRAWREKNNNGEIGQVIDVPSNKIQIGTVEVKVNKNYDTCWLKLHLRDVGPAGWPEKELLQKDVIVPATVKNGLVEFDLDWQNFKLPNKRLYIGFEVLNCSGTKSENPSFLFMGSEEGQNLFRDRSDGEWQVSELYTIYIRMMLK